MGVKKTRTPIAQEHAVIEAYLRGATAKDVGQEFGLNQSTCLNILKRNGIPRRTKRENSRYHLDEDYFASIDTEEKAYWLGFIAADGCVHERKYSKTLRIGLAGKDVQHLRKFTMAISSNLHVTETQRKVRLPQGTEGTYAFCCVSVSSAKMFDDLGKLGIVPRKSLDVAPWGGPDHLMRHYWRGIIDGDGSIFQNSQATWRLNLVGSLAVVSAFAQWITPYCGITPKVRAHGKISRVDIGGMSTPQKAVRILYSDCKIALDRKLALANELIGIEMRGNFGTIENVPWLRIIDEYNAGASAVSLGQKYSLNHGTVRRGITRHGGTLRSWHEAHALMRSHSSVPALK